LKLSLDALTICNCQTTVPVPTSLAVQLLNVVLWAHLAVVADSGGAGVPTLLTTLEHEKRHVDWAGGDGEWVGIVGWVEVNLDISGPVRELKSGHQNLAL
jgi:hypothetical protein